jgi:hypothetical protein
MQRYYQSSLYVFFSLFFTVFYTLALLALIPLIQRPIQYTGTNWIDTTIIYTVHNDTLIKTNWHHKCHNTSIELCSQEVCHLAKNYNENHTRGFVIGITPDADLLSVNSCKVRGDQVMFSDGLSNVFSLIILTILFAIINANIIWLKAKWILLTVHTVMSILILMYSLMGTFYFVIPGYQDVQSYKMIVIQTIALYFITSIYALTMNILLMKKMTKYCCKPHARLPNAEQIYDEYTNYDP